MTYQYFPHLIPLVISAFITLGLTFYGLRYRTVRGGIAFTASMILLTLWSTGNLFEKAAITLDIKIFWANLQYIAYALSPLAGLALALHFVGKYHMLTRKNLLLLLIIPSITIILIWTNQYHGLMRQNVYLDTSGSIPVIAKDYGLWFWLHSFYSHLLNSSAIFLLIRSFWKQDTIYRRQTIPLLIGQLLALIPNVMYITGLSPVDRFDLTPTFFGISGLVVAIGVFHNPFFDLIPIARETIIEKIGTGVIVLDKKNRILDINPEACQMLNYGEKVDIGTDLLNTSRELSQLVDSLVKANLSREELIYIRGEHKYYYEVYLSPLHSSWNNIIARVLLLNDVTDYKQFQDLLTQQKSQIAVMEERERVSRDLHDNLGQLLGFANVQAQTIKIDLSTEHTEQAFNHLDRLIQILQNAHQDLRNYVYNIRAQYINKHLFEIINSIIDEFKINNKTSISLQTTEDFANTTFSNEVKMHIISILKEALNNIAKHAHASEITINIKPIDDRWQLTIIDNGQGFEIAKNREFGSGLKIIQERATLINGRLHIQSTPGQGTKILVNFPT